MLLRTDGIRSNLGKNVYNHSEFLSVNPVVLLSLCMLVVICRGEGGFGENSVKFGSAWVS